MFSSKSTQVMFLCAILLDLTNAVFGLFSDLMILSYVDPKTLQRSVPGKEFCPNCEQNLAFRLQYTVPFGNINIILQFCRIEKV